MSTAIVGTATFASSSTVPAFGDAGSSYPGVVGAAFQLGLNNDVYLARTVKALNGSSGTLPTQGDVTWSNFSHTTQIGSVVISPTDPDNGDGLVIFISGVIVQGNCQVAGEVAAGTTFHSIGTSLFDGDTEFADGATVSTKHILLKTGSTIDGAATTMNFVQKPGANGRKPKRVTSAPDSDHVYSWGDGGLDILYITNLSTTRTFAFDSVGAIDGAEITIVNNDNASSCIITAGDGGASLITLAAGNSCQIIYFQTELNWRLGLH
jgi:hypothetical protein